VSSAQEIDGDVALTRRHCALIAMAALSAGASFARPAAGKSYDSPDSLYEALKAQPQTRLRVGGGTIDVVFADRASGIDRARVLAWVNSSAEAVSTYFGRFPVPHLGLLVIADDGDQVGHASTFGFAGSATRIHVGRGAGDDAFARDWVLVHEMVHLALPNLPRRNLWLQEGNATYVEPIARAQAGQLEGASVWRWSIEGMPKGEPMAGDQGLDHTATWGRTYWGGATFWLLADMSIYQRTRGRRTLQDALRGINHASGGNTAEWSADQVMAAGDAATGTDVLAKLYAREKDTPVPTDLDAIFRELGVAESGGQIVFDEQAPMAAFRRGLTRRRTRS
jgi:hypothetical protein